MVILVADWMAVALPAMQGLAWTILLIGLIQNTIYLSHLPGAWRELRSQSLRTSSQNGWEMLASQTTLPISLIITAYNEELCIEQSVHAALSLQYPDVRVIVVDDGSSDQTLAVLAEVFDLDEVSHRPRHPRVPFAPIRQVFGSRRFPHLTVVTKENGGGKADATNAGLSLVSTPLFCVLDADSILEPTALLNAARAFTETDENVIAVGGTIGVVNGCVVENGQIMEYCVPDNFLARMQMVEYSRAFLMSRLAASRAGTLTLISGAFGLFRTNHVLDTGGFDRASLGEDLELVLRLHHDLKNKGEPYNIRYTAEPVCWTEVPEDLNVLSRQRIRWQRGALQSLSAHRSMVGNPRYGRLGVLTMPLMVVADVLGPLAEAAGLILIPVFTLAGIVNWPFFFAYTAMVFAFGCFLSVTAIAFEQAELNRFKRTGALARLFLAAVTENFGYRQMCSFWRVVGFWRHLRGTEAKWGTMTRRGFGGAPAKSPSSSRTAQDAEGVS